MADEAVANGTSTADEAIAKGASTADQTVARDKSKTDEAMDKGAPTADEVIGKGTFMAMWPAGVKCARRARRHLNCAGRLLKLRTPYRILHTCSVCRVLWRAQLQNSHHPLDHSSAITAPSW